MHCVPFIQNASPHENEKPPFSISSGLKSVFEKFAWHISVNDRRNRGNKVALSNF